MNLSDFCQFSAKEKSVINYPYTVNCAGLYIYKSMRKNATLIDAVCFNHLITNNNHDRKIDDKDIFEQFIYCLSDIVYVCINECNGNICISATIDTGKKSIKKDCENGIEINSFHFNKRHFESVKQLLYFVYTVFCMVYPYNELNYDLIEQNESVKYWIKYYNKKGNIEL